MSGVSGALSVYEQVPERGDFRCCTPVQQVDPDRAIDQNHCARCGSSRSPRAHRNPARSDQLPLSNFPSCKFLLSAGLITIPSGCAPGRDARIKFTAYKYRNSSMVTGKITYVSGDRLIDRANNLPYYSVMIAADADSLQSVGEELKLQAGMPAEVYIEGSKQTALQYLTEPITSTIRRAGRQM